MSVHFLSFISCYRAAAVVCRTVDHQRVFDRFGCKCLDWISTSGLSFDAQECVDKSCFLEFMCVWVGGWVENSGDCQAVVVETRGHG